MNEQISYTKAPQTPGQTNYIKISDIDAGKRLDNLVMRFARHQPRSWVYKLIRSGQVRIDGKRAKPHDRLEIGQSVRLPPAIQLKTSPPAPPSLVKEIEQSVIYSDKDIIVVNKPAGIPVHVGSKFRYGVVELLRASSFGNKSGEIDSEQENMPRFPELVHRLDRLTSGCLVLARNNKALTELQNLWKNRKVNKTYFAVVHGHCDAGQQKVKLPLTVTRNAGQKRVLVDNNNGKDAITIITPLCHGEITKTPVTLIECQPQSGRMHQIRVHCQSIGHPVVGDPLYQNKIQHQWSNKQLGDTLLLHAGKLSFCYNGKTHDFEAEGLEMLVQKIASQSWNVKTDCKI